MERVKGIGPSSGTWQAPVLPLNHTRIYRTLALGLDNRGAKVFIIIQLFSDD